MWLNCICSSSPNKNCNRHVWSTQCGIIFVQCGANASHLLWDISKLMCPRSANATVFIRTMLSTSSFRSSARAFNNISVVFAVILPTFVGVVCKLDNLKSLPLVYQSKRPQISGFTFGVISQSQFIGQRYLSDFSFRFDLSSLLSHLKFTIFARHFRGSFLHVSERLHDFIA